MAEKDEEYTSVTADIIDEYLPKQNKYQQLIDSAARRNLRAPVVSNEQLQAYEKKHLSRDTEKRKHVDEAHERSLTKLAQRSNPLQNTQSVTGIAAVAPKPAIKRLGSELPAPEASASREKKPVRFVDAAEPSSRDQPLRVANRDGTENKFNGTARKGLPQAVVDSAFRRQGFDSSNPVDAAALAAKHSEGRQAFTKAERLAAERSQDSVAERGYDERSQRSRSLSR